VSPVLGKVTFACPEQLTLSQILATTVDEVEVMVALTNLKLPAPGRRQHPATIEHNMLVAAMGIEPPTIDEAPIFVSVEDSMFVNMSLGGQHRPMDWRVGPFPEAR
jgi:hypothetical protein